MTILLGLFRQSQIPVAICIFIDGLDEFEGREDVVIEMMEALADQIHVKVCLSSRPLVAFEEAFSGKPSLRLQDLTFDSIRDYAKVKLAEPIQKYVSLSQTERIQADSLLTRIVERADGVFLWAIIAVRDVQYGLRGIANLNELAQTIESLPTQLESLFVRMLDRISPAFKRDAAHFLGAILYQGTGEDLSDDGGMDLCRLHLSHSQWMLREAPFSYDEVATNDLIAACRTTRKRVKSHTAGLLELTSTEEGDPLYHRWVDLDPIVFTKVNFLHRTVQDFLLKNNEAKLFMVTNGSTEAQVRLSIARGTLAQLIHFSQGDAKYFDHGWFNPVYHPFKTILKHISIAEQLLGATQENLMQYLDYESLTSGYPVSEIRGSPNTLDEAFGITRNSIDLVGMAAAVGMTLYVCQRLDLSLESRGCSPSLPVRKPYSVKIATATSLVWDTDNQPQTSDTSLAYRLRSSNYRQALGECLRWRIDPQLSSRTAVQSEVGPLPETYILACCKPTCHDLVQILLRAGANPMVQVGGPSEHSLFSRSIPFWRSWLAFLLNLRIQYMIANGRSGGLILRYEHISLNEIINTTKALVAQGADINYQMEDYPTREDYYLKRQGLGTGPTILKITASAMFILEECLNSEPEFRELASVIEPLVERPTRKIDYIGLRYSSYVHLNYDNLVNPHPSTEESEELWSLIEKWEDSGRQDDLDALDAASLSIWRAHNPSVRLEERDSYFETS